jgi:WD40 repeat protein
VSTKKPPSAPDAPRFLTDPPPEPEQTPPLLLVTPSPRPSVPEVPSTTTGKPCPLFGVAVSDQDRFIAAAQDNGLVAMWQPVFAQTLGIDAPMMSGAGHTGSVRAVAFEPPCAREYAVLVSGGIDRTIRTWHVADESQNAVWRYEASVLCLAFDPAGARLVSGSADQTIAITSWPTGTLERKFVAHEDSVLTVAVSPDGRQIASGGADRRAYLWSLAGEHLCRIDDDSTHGIVWGMHFLDADHIVFTKGGHVLEWNARSGLRTLYRIPDRVRSVRGLTVRSDRAQIAFAYAHHVVTLDLAGGEPRKRSAHTDEVNGLAYLGDGRLASTADDGALLVWGDDEQPALRLRAASA